MQIYIIKIIGLSLIIFISLLFGIFPLKIKKFSANKKIISFSNCFTAGLFIAIGIFHILPEAHEQIEGTHLEHNEEEHYNEVIPILDRNMKEVHFEEEDHKDEHSDENKHNHFPIAFILAIFTYSLILFIDKVLFNNVEIIKNKDYEIHHNLSNVPFVGNSEFLLSSKYKFFLKNQKNEDFDKNLQISDIAQNNHKESILINDKFTKKEELFNKNEELILSSEELEFEKLIKKSSKTEKKIENMQKNENQIIKKNKKVLTKLENDNSFEHLHTHVNINKTDSILTSYILIIAMGLHGFFEGMAFGVSDKKSEVINILIAILLHKWSEALIVAISLIKAKILFKRALIFILLFISFTPLGVILGWFVFSFNQKVIGIIKALSAGTFIYLACTEILVSEFADSQYKYWKFLFYLLGIAFIMLIGLLE